jgi:U3 small nucleolar ribonucleoprotein component
MDFIAGIRAFNIDDPVDSAIHTGVLGMGSLDDLTPEQPDRFAQPVEQFVDEELDAITTDQPAAQQIYGEVVVVLEDMLVDVLEDDVEYRYEIDAMTGQAICTDKTDDETGLVAERTVPDDRLADGMQRSADALDHALEWVDVISPRSLSGVAEAAEDLYSDTDGDRP